MISTDSLKMPELLEPQDLARYFLLAGAWGQGRLIEAMVESGIMSDSRLFRRW
jgi:hypothetical protein